MKLKTTAGGVALALAAAMLGLSAGPASAASAGMSTRLTLQTRTAAAAVSEMPQSRASTCLNASKSPTFTYATRLDWCASFEVVVTLDKDGEPIGTATMEQVDYASWKVSSRTWNLTDQLYTELGATEALVGATITVTAVSSCSTGCKITSGHRYELKVPLAPSFTGDAVGVASPGKATVTSHLKTTWGYEANGLPAVPPLDESTVGVRCDSQRGYRYPNGCANPSFRPTYVVSASRYPDIAKFDRAEIAKHPSWSTLTRVSPAQAAKNRGVACKGFKAPPGKSCDEYPYASTSQGGAGAARLAVNEKENDSQGGNLVGFYNANRLFYGEKFNVKVS
jgi:hypothetical protein